MTRSRVVVTGTPVAEVDRRLFGAFVEHLGRSIHTGVHEPGHPAADEHGFRRDVVALVRELGVSTVRYPGGNFVSGYRWEDGVGPVEDRPRRLDLAWHSTETNEVGLHEFARWLDTVDGRLMYALNLGTRGVAEALDVMEYMTVPGGTTLSDLRVAHGRAEPFAVDMWCLGNEMDGPWQLGHRSAEEYGRLAATVARAMHQLDPTARLVVCGSSGHDMPTFGSWERTVLGHTYDEVDAISCHAYYSARDGDLQSFVASGDDLVRFVRTVAEIADSVRDERGSDRTMAISFDEWNIWDVERYEQEDKRTAIDDWPVAPRLLEDVYTVLDAVTLGGLLVGLLTVCDRVRSASLAQLVNVIAPIMTEPGGPSWRQTTFHPFAITSRLARGTALRVEVEAPSVTTRRQGEVPLVAAAATRDDAAGRAAVFLVNRDLDRAQQVDVRLDGVPATEVVEAWSLHDEDLSAVNSRDRPDRVVPAPASVDLSSGVLTLDLAPASWTAVSLATT